MTGLEARDNERDALAQVIQNAEDGDLTANGWSRKPGPSQRRAAEAVLEWLDARKHQEPEITEEGQWEYRTTVGGYDPQPHARLTRGDATEAEVLAMLADDPRPLILERRRPAGPWMPVGEGEQRGDVSR